ncbi:MAG TPA: class 1 fructose-bisphosphatase [Syntrophorhabdaceae bacterium]|jgi:fructose-1,6-bisphosphatase I|nr:fructose-1,6-bisphosphatase [Syntrophorhabdaceae bacterium]MDI9560459.1 class 1 fructose-bisphosphatase [Pseudomonadota bacterium]OQC48722.1 MAG: Fructose-1,6-bisphosphatase class 1 [Deltaproteobacteria bacterium ADurb.Bin026]MBP8698639.1 fructose-1,6-bisphosphatase [Syntrophorhabdaceae bacterium]HOF58104.1 class 1 fructose-bisphosphatase [Syntrophorhabdaceae bacterium]
MIHLEQTFMNFLLAHQEKYNRTYHFLILMDSLISAAKHIQHYYLTGALKGILGLANKINVQGEDVMRMDQIAHEIAIHYLKTTNRVIHAVSEEEDDIIPLNEEGGRYFIYFDPLDGSSNVAHGLPVGFLFGIAKRNLEGPEDGHLRAGKDYIAAGMFVIPTGTFTLALKEAGTWRFHINDTMNYVMPVRMMLPEDKKTWELSFNAANQTTYAKGVQDWISANVGKYSYRYLGALAGDFHRTLSNGGMFMYPAIVNHPNPKKNRPEGKLRLMYEASVVAFMSKEAGGGAVDENGTPILDIVPSKHHQRTALYVGSKPLVDEIAQVLRNR